MSLSSALARATLVPAHAVAADLGAGAVEVLDPEGRRRALGFDRLVLAPGSVTRMLPIPGSAERAKGFKTLAQALYLRDHVLAQLELANAGSDPAERAARCTFVVVGAGYTGTEVAAQGQLFTRAALRRYPRVRPDELHWLLVDQAPRILPELGRHMSEPALRLLRARGLDVRLNTTVEEVTDTAVHLSDGTTVPTRTLVWAVGVTPGPLVHSLDVATVRGRVVVDEYLQVPGHPQVFAVGDAAAVPDLTKPGQVTPMTAQHAQRQGKVVARNVAASLGYGSRRAYRHRNMGFVVDLGGWQAVADPLGIPLSGPVAKVLTRAYHLFALPQNPLRVATDWFNDILEHRQFVQLGLVTGAEASPTIAEHLNL